MRRPRPQLFPTNMALRDGLPATGSARALFSLVFQRPVAQSFGPADFLVSGLFQDAYLQAVPMPGRQAACFSGCLGCSSAGPHGEAARLPRVRPMAVG
jgi:hypothetical protein